MSMPTATERPDEAADSEHSVDVRPDVHLDDLLAELAAQEPWAPDTSTVDVIELVGTPLPDADLNFDQRVSAVVSALAGLDRKGIHHVLDRAGRIARMRAIR
jgi:hypothetical protein